MGELQLLLGGLPSEAHGGDWNGENTEIQD